MWRWSVQTTSGWWRMPLGSNDLASPPATASYIADSIARRRPSDISRSSRFSSSIAGRSWSSSNADHVFELPVGVETVDLQPPDLVARTVSRPAVHQTQPEPTTPDVLPHRRDVELLRPLHERPGLLDADVDVRDHRASVVHHQIVGEELTAESPNLGAQTLVLAPRSLDVIVVEGHHQLDLVGIVEPDDHVMVVLCGHVGLRLRMYREQYQPMGRLEEFRAQVVARAVIDDGSDFVEPSIRAADQRASVDEDDLASEVLTSQCLVRFALVPFGNGLRVAGRGGIERCVEAGTATEIEPYHRSLGLVQLVGGVGGTPGAAWVPCGESHPGEGRECVGVVEDDVGAGGDADGLLGEHECFDGLAAHREDLGLR
jgi:hypothetical protein